MSRNNEITTRPLGPGDRSIVQWALSSTVSWTDPEGIPPLRSSTVMVAL